MIDKVTKNKKIIIYITFNSDKEDLTFICYLQCPKPMI